MNKGVFWGPKKKIFWSSWDWKGYKTISKEFGLHQSTVRHIVYKLRKFTNTVTRAARYWKKNAIFFFSTLRYILQYEKIQEFSSDDLNSTSCYAALLLSCGQLTCTDLTCFCCTELWHKWSNKLCYLSLWQQMQGTVDTEHVFDPEYWHCFSFCKQVFVFWQFSLVRC